MPFGMPESHLCIMFRELETLHDNISDRPLGGEYF